MKRLIIPIDRIGWRVVLLLGATCHDEEQVLRELRKAGIEGDNAEAARLNVSACRPNNGITYTSPRGVSVVVIGATTSTGELINTIAHETLHLANHIAEAIGVRVDEELIAYAVGDFARECFCTFFSEK